MPSPLALFRYCLAQMLNCLVFGFSVMPEPVATPLLFLLALAHVALAAFLSYHPAVQQAPLLPTIHLPTLPKGSRVVLLGVAALGAFFFLPPLIRLVYPSFGGFAPDTINAYTLGAAQYFLALTMAYAGWRLLFPSLYDYAAETMEGKLLESITADLLSRLEQVHRHFDRPDAKFSELSYLVDATKLDFAKATERRKIATLQFTIRCTRFVFCCLPFFLLLWLANAALTAALTAVPASAPAL